MTYNPQKHHRQSIRLKGYDYTQAGAYFVTLCVHERECALGRVVNGEMEWSDFGRIAAESWRWLAKQYPYVTLDAWVVMPNHLHGIIVIHHDGTGRGGSRTAPTPNKPLGRLVGAFKTVSTKRINQIRGNPGVPFWQRNYYEHVVRDADDLRRIQEYIQNNPALWNQDRYYA